MDDAVALLLFAFSVSIAGSLLGGDAAGAPSLAAQLLGLVWEIGGSVVSGALIALLLSKLIKGFMNEDRILAFSLGAIMLLTGVTVITSYSIHYTKLYENSSYIYISFFLTLFNPFNILSIIII